MTPELQNQLNKYMKTNGYYDTKQIRMDEGMSERSAKFMDIFGGADESDPEKQSELLAAAVAYNAAKVETDEQAERDGNTIEAVYEDLLTHDTTAVDEKRVIRRTEHMHPDALRQLVIRMVNRLAELEAMTYVPERTREKAENNRILWLLREMHLADELGDIADGDGRVSLQKARRFLAGQPTAAAQSVETEEELATKGL